MVGFSHPFLIDSPNFMLPRLFRRKTQSQLKYKLIQEYVLLHKSCLVSVLKRNKEKIKKIIIN